LVDSLARVDRAKFREPVSGLNLDPVEALFCYDALVDVGEQNLLAFFFCQNYLHCLLHCYRRRLAARKVSRVLRVNVKRLFLRLFRVSFVRGTFQRQP
jgi:hypothetical protein